MREAGACPSTIDMLSPPAAAKPTAVLCSPVLRLWVVHQDYDLFNELCPGPDATWYRWLVTFVKERAGNDLRYAIDAEKITRELGWKQRHIFETGLRETVSWYLEHYSWIGEATSGDYRNWIAKQYASR